MSLNFQDASPWSERKIPLRTPQIEGREWWLWGFAVTVTLALTAGIVFLTFFGDHAETNAPYWTDLREWVRGLAAFVLLFDIYTMYQHLQLQRVRRQLADRDELFQLITENAADMIAVVDGAGRRLYNSPAYQKVLGYSAVELSSGSSIDQIHSSDRERVLQAAAKARATGQGQRLEYRMRHKDGSWRILESTASPIQNAEGGIERLVIVNRDITERKRAEEMLAHSSFHDGLTDLPNRALFVDRLQHAVTRSRRRHDVLARLGGDEFTVLLEDVFEPSDAIRVAQRIQERLATPFEIEGQRIVIAASIGIASSSGSYAEAEEMLRDAEIAMYRAKRAGKARCEVFDPAMHSSAVRRLKLETDLRLGIERGELIVYYQPIVSLTNGKIIGFEALSRWQRPEGMVSPAEFIPVADETGLILPINKALLLEACKQLRSWQSQFDCDPPLTMSMNITPRQFAQAELAKDIGEMLRDTGVDPNTINLEIMETIAMGDADRALSVLSELKALGVRLSIDDFGTGYSSLSRLPRFPIDALKIDRVFISNMNTDHDSHEIVRLIIMLAHSVGLKVVAEGTETEEQIAGLKRLGCEMAQGYLYSPPVDQRAAFGLLLQSYEEVVSS